MTQGLVNFSCFGLQIKPNDPDIRAKILHLESVLMALPDEYKTEFELRHHFAPGTYAREIIIPKGCLLVGKIHKTEHLCIVSKGSISILTEAGVQMVNGPCTFVSPPGVKRVGFTHEDTIWTTIHATDERDIQKLEDQLTVKTYRELQPYVAGDVLGMGD